MGSRPPGDKLRPSRLLRWNTGLADWERHRSAAVALKGELQLLRLILNASINLTCSYRQSSRQWAAYALRILEGITDRMTL